MSLQEVEILEDGEDSLSLKKFWICKPKYIFGKILTILQLVYVETLHMMLRAWSPSYTFKVTHKQNAEKGVPFNWSRYGATPNNRSPSLHFLSTDTGLSFHPSLKDAKPSSRGCTIRASSKTHCSISRVSSGVQAAVYVLVIVSVSLIIMDWQKAGLLKANWPS